MHTTPYNIHLCSTTLTYQVLLSYFYRLWLDRFTEKKEFVVVKSLQGCNGGFIAPHNQGFYSVPQNQLQMATAYVQQVWWFNLLCVMTNCCHLIGFLIHTAWQQCQSLLWWWYGSQQKRRCDVRVAHSAQRTFSPSSTTDSGIIRFLVEFTLWYMLHVRVFTILH